jgi:AcrR family transcriptional regulator
VERRVCGKRPGRKGVSRLTAAARALFAHKGFAATTTQEIAQAADVAIGTLFLYAKTKEDLLIQVFHEEMIDVVEQAFERARARRTLLDQLLVFFDALVAYHEQDIPLARALLRQLSYVQNNDQRAAVRDLMRGLLRRIVILMEAANARGEIASSMAHLKSAEAVFALYYFRLGMLMNGFIGRTQFDGDLRQQLDLLLSGFGSARGPVRKLVNSAANAFGKK